MRNDAWSLHGSPIVWAALPTASGTLFQMKQGHAYTLWVVAKCANGPVSAPSEHRAVTVQ